MRRLIVAVAVVVLVMAVVWIVSKPIERFGLGPGEILVTRPGVNVLLVGDGRGAWLRFDAASRSASDGVPLPADLEGLPAIEASGAVVLLRASGLVRLPAEGGEELLLGRTSLPLGTSLLGVAGTGPPVLAVPVGDGWQIHLAERARSDDAGGRLVALQAGDTVAGFAADGEALISPWSAAVAFLGAQGWESWATQGGPLLAVTRARGCTGAGAIFAPDGKRLIVPGKIEDIWQLDLETGRLSFMANGNLGGSRRIPSLKAFQRDPDRLVGARRTMDGILHIYYTHLGGGGTFGFKVGFMHDYNVALSWDGNLMVYCQAEFDEEGDKPFDEALYCLDQSQSAAAVLVDYRKGGQPHAGPVFIGRSDAFVFVGDGEIEGVVFHRPSVETPP